jgi:hypothetical protein
LMRLDKYGKNVWFENSDNPEFSGIRNSILLGPQHNGLTTSK